MVRINYSPPVVNDMVWELLSRSLNSSEIMKPAQLLYKFDFVTNELEFNWRFQASLL
jgi:hypothetical protein